MREPNWTEPELSLFSQVPKIKYKEIALLLPHRTFVAIRNKGRKIHKDRNWRPKLSSGCFSKGFTPWNKDRIIPIEDRIKNKFKVDPNNNCWIWQGFKDKDGYGSIIINQKMNKPHRVMWEIHNGPIPEGINVLHKCDNPPCVNPDHLFLGSQKDNIQDCIKKDRFVRGEKNGRAKLTKNKVIKIYYDNRKYAEIAKDFSVSKASVGSIKKGRNWAHLNLTLPLVLYEKWVDLDTLKKLFPI